MEEEGRELDSSFVLVVIVVEGLVLVSLPLAEEQHSGHPLHLCVLAEEVDVRLRALLYLFDMALAVVWALPLLPLAFVLLPPLLVA
jgi:hypothetical protein